MISGELMLKSKAISYKAMKSSHSLHKFMDEEKIKPKQKLEEEIVAE